ncbi:unnamed protein product [Trifolium pratense]|uniref:Uncharacterized protein n=1 Tax=Trifolium pratense TaxID=57577 RepID=A0ACB0J0Y2_TRIPR|nr:unnamed protein product [Trifolium pratense]
MATEEVIGNSAVGNTEKPFIFEGLHFKRWQQKMFFFLTLKKCAYVLKEPIPVVPEIPAASGSGTKEQTVTNGEKSVSGEKDSDTDQIRAQALQAEKEKQIWISHDYVCKNYIINGLEDDLYDYYRTYSTARDVWEALSKKYDTEEAGVKKYAVSRYLKYQMVDERSVEVQSHELQKIAHEIITEGMPLDEQFQIAVIIDKLPPGWKDFKNQLRHKTKEFSIESLITRLRIEEEARKQDQKEEEKILVVSNNKKKFGAALKPTGKPLKNQNRNQNRIKNGNPPRAPSVRQQQPPPPPVNESGEFLCFNCWKPGHVARKCRGKKRPRPAALNAQVNATDEAYTAMITEINMVGVTDGWWIDTGATRHVCYERAMFKTYTSAENKKVQMGNAHTSDVADDSKATSGFIFSIAGGAVSWKSKKQTILAQSTMESEMIALATASEEASWLRCLLSEIPLWEKPMPAVLIHCDITAAIAKIENRYYNGKRRQIRRKHSTVRDLLTKGAVRVDHVRTDDNLADPLTKGLAREKVYNTSVKMGLMPTESLVRLGVCCNCAELAEFDWNKKRHKYNTLSLRSSINPFQPQNKQAQKRNEAKASYDFVSSSELIANQISFLLLLLRSCIQPSIPKSRYSSFVPFQHSDSFDLQNQITMLLRFFSFGFRSIKGAVDWRKKGALAPVKNQGCSGVCTLMACIASIESIFQIKSPSGDLIELSSQHMLNCIARQYSRHKGVSGPRIDAVIDGINEVDIFKFAITKGIPTEKAFPYKEVSEAIKSIKDPLPDFKEKYFIDTYQWIRERSTKDGGASG